MRKILVNAVSAKVGGARTVVENFALDASLHKDIEFIFLCGFEKPNNVGENINWIYKPKSGLSALVFTFFFSIYFYIKYNCDAIISFNNVNSIFPVKKITYFHQFKVFDSKCKDIKVFVYKLYYFLFCSDVVVLQTKYVKSLFESKFKNYIGRTEIVWPGVDELFILEQDYGVRKCNTVLVPYTDITSKHKNFLFVEEFALKNPQVKVLVTAEGVSNIFNIEFIGIRNKNELKELYASSKFVLFPSLIETIGLPIFESLLSKTCVISCKADYIDSHKEEYSIGDELKVVSHVNDIDMSEFNFLNDYSYLVDSDWKEFIKVKLSEL